MWSSGKFLIASGSSLSFGNFFCGVLFKNYCVELVSTVLWSTGSNQFEIVPLKYLFYFIFQQTCTNTPGSYYCACREQGYKFNERTGECEDINECKLGTHDCSTDLRCKNTDGGFLCKPKKTTTTTTTRFEVQTLNTRKKL